MLTIEQLYRYQKLVHERGLNGLPKEDALYIIEESVKLVKGRDTILKNYQEIEREYNITKSKLEKLIKRNQLKK